MNSHPQFDTLVPTEYLKPRKAVPPPAERMHDSILRYTLQGSEPEPIV